MMMSFEGRKRDRKLGAKYDDFMRKQIGTVNIDLIDDDENEASEGTQEILSDNDAGFELSV